MASAFSSISETETYSYHIPNEHVGLTLDVTDNSVVYGCSPVFPVDVHTLRSLCVLGVIISGLRIQWASVYTGGFFCHSVLWPGRTVSVFLQHPKLLLCGTECFSGWLNLSSLLQRMCGCYVLAWLVLCLSFLPRELEPEILLRVNSVRRLDSLTTE